MTTLSDVERCVWRLTGWRDEPWVSELLSVVEAYGLAERAAVGKSAAGNGLRGPLTGVEGHRVGNSPVGVSGGERLAERPLDPGSAQLLANLEGPKGTGEGQGGPGSGQGDPGDAGLAGRSKECSKCGERKPLRLFWKSAKSADGHMGVCGRCKSEARRRGESLKGKRVGGTAVAGGR